MTSLNFLPIGAPDPEPPDGYDDGGCTCPPGDNRYQLAIEEGGVYLTHTACGKPPGHTWGDWNDLVTMNPTPVTVEWKTDCDGSPWHGMDPCDCDHLIQITPDTAAENPECPCPAAPPSTAPTTDSATAAHPPNWTGSPPG